MSSLYYIYVFIYSAVKCICLYHAKVQNMCSDKTLSINKINESTGEKENPYDFFN